jgi:hypothetical protein
LPPSAFLKAMIRCESRLGRDAHVDKTRVWAGLLQSGKPFLPVRPGSEPDDLAVGQQALPQTIAPGRNDPLSLVSASESSTEALTQM